MIKMVSKLRRAISKKLATRESFIQTIVDQEKEIALLREQLDITCKQHKKSQKIIKKQNKLIKKLLNN